ncbi:MAG TPA: hypothetical protein VNO35_21660 [Steroidobacteraceae bacterium]|nr:hypothetical protein [Steroidobacteraceae bacterium]
MLAPQKVAATENFTLAGSRLARGFTLIPASRCVLAVGGSCWPKLLTLVGVPLVVVKPSR